MSDLDPKTRMLLDLMAAANEPPLAEQSIDEFRARRERGRDIVNAPWPAPAVLRDTQVDGAAGPLQARIYDVVNADARPTLVYFHGGGFVYGSIESHDAVCRRLADIGSVRVISVDYRLAPEAPFPAAVDDAIAAVCAIASEPSRYGVDATRLALGGDSAGGNLAAVAARHFARAKTLRIAFQLLIYPVTQTGPTPSREAFASGYFLTAEAMAAYDRLYVPQGTDQNDERLSPLRAPPPKGLAPAYIVTAGFDPLLDEGRDYARSLREAGIAATHIDYADQIHGFFNFTRFSSAAEEAIAAAAKAVGRALS